MDDVYDAINLHDHLYQAFGLSQHMPDVASITPLRLNTLHATYDPTTTTTTTASPAHQSHPTLLIFNTFPGTTQSSVPSTRSAILHSSAHNLSDLFQNATITHTEEHVPDASSPILQWQEVLLVIMLCVLIVITVIGNTLVILAVLTTRRLRTVTNCFVMSLAVADWLVGIFVMPPSVAVYLIGSCFCTAVYIRYNL